VYGIPFRNSIRTGRGSDNNGPAAFPVYEEPAEIQGGGFRGRKHVNQLGKGRAGDFRIRVKGKRLNPGRSQESQGEQERYPIFDFHSLKVRIFYQKTLPRRTAGSV
jgi:hypothetical protein